MNVVKKEVSESSKPSTSGLLNDVMMPNIRFVGAPLVKPVVKPLIEPSVIDSSLNCSSVGVDSVNQLNSPLDEIAEADREIDIFRQLIEDNDYSFSGFGDESRDILEQLVKDLDDMEGIDTVD